MSKFIKWCFIFSIISIVFIHTSSAGDMYHPRSSEITQALDGAAYSHSRNAAASRSRKLEIDKAMSEMPFKPTGAKNRSTQTIARESVEPVSVPVIVPESNVKLASKSRIEQSPRSYAEPPPKVEVEKKSTKEPSAKNPDSLAYRYFDLKNPENSLKVGVELLNYNYQEQSIMEMDGNMGGVFFEYAHRFH